MRRLRVVLGLMAGLLGAVLAGPAAGAQGLEWGGELRGELRLPAGEDFRFAEGGLASGLLRLDLHLGVQPSERLRLFAEAALKAQGLPGTLASLDDLASLEALAPIGFELVEAYADLYGFLLPQLDLRVGRQRIVWGTAEKVSVIGNVNPLNLEDPWDYGRRLASDAVKLKAYLSALTLEAVYVPYFTPALLPADSSSLLSPPAGATSVSYAILPPGDELWGNATLGARLSAAVGGWDVAASYLYGRQSLPAAARVTIDMDMSADVDLSYPRQHVAGLDAAGELFGVGVWGEAAVFWPDSVLVTDTTAVGGGLEETRAQWYAKWALGLDYTFTWGLYANLQYVHGFYNENSPEALNDYLLVGLEWKLLQDRLKVGPLGVAWEVDDLQDIAGSWGLALNPELSFFPVDAAQFTVGLRWLTGKAGTAFGGQKDEGELYLRMVFSF